MQPALPLPCFLPCLFAFLTSRVYLCLCPLLVILQICTHCFFLDFAHSPTLAKQTLCLSVQIEVDDNGIIVDAKFKTFGCGSAIAASSLATEKIMGLGLDDALKLTNKDLASELQLPPVKLHCSMLAEEAIQAAVHNYQKKQEPEQVRA
eukprot:m.192476 g.192476  ORF g.192476 m.192476 type:complete len:149 (-) comp14855_c0_seq6:514-960(-)